jgi:hypothetical protein
MKEEGRKDMYRRKNNYRGANLLLMATALLAVIFLMNVPAHAACDVDGDGDCDGFADSAESGGISLCDGTTYTGLVAGSKDLFVIVKPESNTTPLAGMTSPLEFSTAVRSHQILESQAGCLTCTGCNDRSITEFQKAARIKERIDTADTSGTDDSLGWTDAVGAANGPIPYGDAYVYTERIKNWVNLKCGTKACRTSDSVATNKDAITLRYQKHTMAHEFGHMLDLKQLPDSRIGNHYIASTSGTRYNLDQYVYFKNYVFYMGTIFKNPDDFNNAKPR